MSIVRVALDVPLPTLFDYALPPATEITQGQRVLVQFGRMEMAGIAMDCVPDSKLDAKRIKPLLRALDDIPLLSADLLALLRFCSNYYHYPIGATVMGALPAPLRLGKSVTPRQSIHYELSDSGRSLDLDKLPKRNLVQRRLLAALAEGPLSDTQVRQMSSSATAALKTVLQSGWVRTAERPDSVSACRFSEPHLLNEKQRQAVSVVAETDGYRCFLLLGVTGSGKTETYMHMIHQVLQQGGQALVLVPEINLTPQMESYFHSRFPDTDLVSLHSGLADGERAQNWMKARSGRARIVLGTRLAVFTPLPQLALIIVDEEHDASFKQQEGLRYSARDVAIFRASQGRFPIVLGSATPSLESFYNASNGRYTLLELTERATQARLPDVRCIDSRLAMRHHEISEPLLAAIEKRLQCGEQSLIFINRRGYAPVLMCTSCGWLSGCTRCAGKLVLHLRDRCLRCHHCGHQERVPHTCPGCGNPDLHPVGIGTQRVEEALQKYFPRARILRVDRDSTRNKGIWDDMRRQIQDDKVDILVGTQILAKGHDFPNLTLVGVLNPDSALYSGDFRAPEKLFALLSQVAGRAGRAGKPGEVLVQTAFPDHPLFRALGDHDYKKWAGIQLEERKLAGFPPFVHQAMLRAEGKQEEAVHAFLRQARVVAEKLALPVTVYDIVPSAMPLRAGLRRSQLLVQSTSRKLMQEFLGEWKPLLDSIPAQKMRWNLDVDPLEF